MHSSSRRTCLLGIVVLLALVVSASAVAKSPPAVPNSAGVSQYIETVPTAGGGTPSSTQVRAGGSANRPTNAAVISAGNGGGTLVRSVVIAGVLLAITAIALTVTVARRRANRPSS